MTARDDLRRMAFDIATSSAVVQPHELDAALDAHAAEVRAATLADADAAITAAIDRDRALFPARSSDRAALGAAREIIRNLAAPAGCQDDLAAWIDRQVASEPEREKTRRALSAPAARPACRWPDCLTPEQRGLLEAQVDAGMRGMPTAPIPDQRGACGCTDLPADDTQQQETPRCECGHTQDQHGNGDSPACRECYGWPHDPDCKDYYPADVQQQEKP